MRTKRGNATCVNPTKKTPAPVAGGRGRGGRGRGGRSKELPILGHAAVGEHAVKPPTRSPSSSPHSLGLSPSPDDIDLVKCQFHEVLMMLENRDFVLYSQPVGIIHLRR